VGRHLIFCILALTFFPLAVRSASSQAERADSIVLPFDPAALHKQMWDDLKPRLARLAEMDARETAKTASNWPDYDMTYYRLDLTIDHVNQLLYGRVGISGFVVATSLDSVMVNLLNNMTVDSVYDQTGNLVYIHQDDHITIYLDKVYAQGERFFFTVVYHGTPTGGNSFAGFRFSSRNGLPLITTLSQPFGARSWWPCNDITRDKADSVDIIVTVDTSLAVSSNGLIASDVDNGNGTHTTHWKSRYPIAPYLVSLGIHPYAVWYDYYVYGPDDSMPIQFHVYPDQDQYSRQFFDGIVAHMIGVLSVPFGQYPFIEEKYGCTHFDWNGAMEHQTNTSTVASAFGYSQPIIVHELGHQWWGDLVTCGDWHHIWLNEGFATYAEALYFEADNGSDYYHTYMNSFDYGGGGSIYIQDTTDLWNIFSARVYDKGGWVLHMLRHVVGDSLFFQALTEYRRLYGWSYASTEDFQAAVEAASGMDLDYFFQEWIYGAYRPEYRYSYLWEPNPAGGWKIYLFLRQVQTTEPTFFTMPVDVGISTTDGEEIHTVFNDRQGQHFVLHTKAQPLGVQLDPDRWISRLAVPETYTLHIVNDSLADGWLVTRYIDTVQVRGTSGGFLCDVISGLLPGGLAIEPATGVISGIPSDTGSYTFMVRAIDQTNSAFRDSVQYTIKITPALDRPGDVNLDGITDIGDVVFLINYIFRGGTAPLLPDWADVNVDCEVGSGDAVFLIDYIFRDGPAPQLGCVE
jgi:cytochrome c1